MVVSVAQYPESLWKSLSREQASLSGPECGRESPVPGPQYHARVRRDANRKRQRTNQKCGWLYTVDLAVTR